MTGPRLVVAAVLLAVGWLPSAATGTVLHGHERSVRLRLDKRTLDLRLPARRRAAGDVLTVTCGDAAALEGWSDPGWTIRTTRRLRLRGARTHYVLRFATDVSGRANGCALTSPAGTYDAQVALSPAPGSGVPACRPFGPERVVARSSEALVLRTAAGDAETLVDAYRACLLPRGRPIPLDEAFSGIGSGGGLSRVVLTGHWVAWSGIDPKDELAKASISLVDLLGERSFVDPFGPPRLTGRADTSALALAADGTLAWVVGSADDSELAVARPGQTRSLIDRIGAPGRLSAPSLSPDGETISWLRDGVAQHAPVPAQPIDPTPSAP